SAFIKANRQLERKNAVKGALDVGTDQDCIVEIALIDKKCKALVGDVEYQITDKANQEMWSRINKVYGTITVNEAESDLRLLKNITVEGWSVRALRIINNRKLKYIDAILDMKVDGPKPSIYFRNNSRARWYVNDIGAQFNMTGLESIGQIYGNVVVVTEKLEDVPPDMKKKLIEVTDGKATFLTFAQYKASRTTTTNHN
ncbi:hypothetical protein COOONC_04559, partial [Cooperia oncophora]